MNATKFDWMGELNKNITHNLATTFGLDFLLFDDKTGGNVDTIHNVRKGIWATNKERKHYQNRESYDSSAYHSHSNYRNKGKQDKIQHQSNSLIDKYRRRTLIQSETRHLDHIISAKQIHDDAGRVLSESDGILLANMDSNLQSTHWVINNAKKDHSVEKFLNEIMPNSIQKRKDKIRQCKLKISKIKGDTPQERHQKRQLQAEIQKNQDYINSLESIDKKSMLQADKEARKPYNQEIALAYYSSSKFLKNTGNHALSQGFAMGRRQAIGIILAEVWFELKELIPRIINQCKNDFRLSIFWKELKTSVVGVFERVKLRFQEIIRAFKDNFINGILSSITTTILNIFLTSTKLMTRLIRESWSNLVQVVKLLFFNPNKLSLGDLFKEVTRLILTGFSVTLGIILNQHLSSMLIMPFGAEISTFISALFTGLLTVGVAYFIDHSSVMQKIWQFLDKFKNKYAHYLEHMREINAELDAYITELARLEFNLNTQELKELSDALYSAKDEYEKNEILKTQTDKRNIKLPYKMGSHASMMNWLRSKAKKLHG